MPNDKVFVIIDDTWTDSFILGYKAMVNPRAPNDVPFAGGCFEPMGGTVNAGETHLAGLVREVKEESGGAFKVVATGLPAAPIVPPSNVNGDTYYFYAMDENEVMGNPGANNKYGKRKSTFAQNEMFGTYTIKLNLFNRRMSVADVAAVLEVEAKKTVKKAGQQATSHTIQQMQNSEYIKAVHHFIVNHAKTPASEADPNFDPSALNVSAPKSKIPPAYQPPKPPKNSGDNNLPATKHYVFNETGNICVASTTDKDGTISPAAQDLFQEVAVFFAAMTKALAETPKPNSTPPYSPRDFYTLYDYEGIEAIINRSGMFVNVSREDLHIEHHGTMATFNTELIASLLGFAMSDGAAVESLEGALRAMGNHATLGYSQGETSLRLAHLMFICEYMMGLPLVSVKYYSLSDTDTKSIVDIGPCIKINNSHVDIKVHKDTFLFVVPAWIHKYAGDLDSVASDQNYQLLINELKGYITDTPIIVGVYDGSAKGTPIADNQLADSKTYSLGLSNATTAIENAKAAVAKKLKKKPKGKFEVGSITIGGVAQKVASSAAWGNQNVTFTAVKTGAAGTTALGPVVIQLNDTAKTQITTTQIYEVQ